MRFKEFRILKENKENVVVIGDSIAVGIASAGNVSKEYTLGGKNTSYILQNFVIPFAKSGKAKGATVILSSGAANSANVVNSVNGEKLESENLSPVNQQIKLLKDAGATVKLVGVASGRTPPQNPTQYIKGKKWVVDYTGMNNRLASIASANGAEFLGPLEDFDPSIRMGDGIHPFNGYKKLFQAGAAGASSTASTEPATDAGKKFYAIGDSHARSIGSSGKFENLASDGRSAFSRDNDSAIEKVVEGSTVVLSAGGNDMSRSDKQAVSDRINDLINKLKDKKAKVYYVLIGETDSLRFANDRNKLRQIVKANLPSGIEILDIGKLSVENGDGIHAPPSWYAQAAQTVKSGGRATAPIGNAAASPGAPRIKDKQNNQEMKLFPLKAGPPFSQEDAKAVEIMQKKLVDLGYPVGPSGIDGKFGTYTSAALSAFKKDYHDVSDSGKEYTADDFLTMKKIADNKLARVSKPTNANQNINATRDKLQQLDPSSANAVGRVYAEKFLGRALQDEEWDMLLRATYAEASPNTREQGYVMAVILNRARSGRYGGNSVQDVLYAKNQFQAVTGTRADNHKPSANYLRGPSGRSLDSILTASVSILPEAPKNIYRFTANNPAAYGPGTNINYLYTLRQEPQAQVIGGTIFA